MVQILINLIAGALGGAATGKASPNFDLGTIGNIISGLVGGGVLGQIVTLALPSVVAAAESGNLSVGGVVSQLVAGGAGGAILTAIIGAIKEQGYGVRPKASLLTWIKDADCGPVVRCGAASFLARLFLVQELGPPEYRWPNF